jgi:hypothetical protein
MLRPRIAIAIVGLSGLSLAVNGQGLDAPTWTLLPELRVNANAEDLNVAHRLVFLRNGSMSILEGQTWRVMTFDATGRRIGTSGGKGAGPGEFTGAARGGWIADTAWFYDQSQRRTSFFTSTGTFVRTASLPQSSRGGAGASLIDGSCSPWGVLRDGLVMVCQRVSDKGWTIVRAATTGGVQGIIAAVPLMSDGMAVGDGSRFVDIPFVASPIHDVSSDGTRTAVVVTETGSGTKATVRATMLGVRGDTVFSRAYPITGERPTDAAVNTALDRVRNAPTPAQRAALDEVKRRMGTILPPVRSGFVARDSSLWLQLRDSATHRMWVNISARGAVTRRVVTSQNVVLLEAAGDLVWGLEVDSDGFGNPVRYRLRAPR